MLKRWRVALSLSIALASLLAVGLFLDLATSPTGAATEVTVCLTGPGCDYNSIQVAVDAVDIGTTIRVATGTYTDVHVRHGITQVVYLTKTVTIQGGYTTAFTEPPDPDAHPTILDASGQGRVVYIEGSISPIIRGLDVTGGDATGLGGGAWGGYDVGGGVAIITASATLYDCRIYGNFASTARWGGGGGVYVWGSSAVLEDNLITQNVASAAPNQMGEGGGIALADSVAALIGNEISDNTASLTAPSTMGGFEGIGGGIYTEASNNQFRNNLIHTNVASVNGDGGGGAIWLGLGDISTFVNTAIFGNVGGPAPNSLGSALVSEWSYPIFHHSTIHGNLGGGDDEDAVAAILNSVIAMTNTILVDQDRGVSIASGSAATIDGILWHNVTTTVSSLGVITLTNEVTGTPNLAADGYHLQWGSIAIEAGVASSITTDIDGDPRPIGLRPDLGSDEWLPSVVVDPAITATLMYTPPLIGPISVIVPAGAVVQTTTLTLEPLASPGHPLPSGVSFLGQAFDLMALCLRGPDRAVYLPLVLRSPAAYLTSAVKQDPQAVEPARIGPLGICGDPLVPCPTFNKPVTISAWYDPNGVTDLTSVTLYLWDGTQWTDAATTCTPASVYSRDPIFPVITLEICHLTRFAIGGE